MIKHINIPRLAWVNKNWTLKQVHHEMFNFIKGIISIWYDQAASPEGKSKGITVPTFRQPTIAEGQDSEMTKEEFENFVYDHFMQEQEVPKFMEYFQSRHVRLKIKLAVKVS